MISSIKWCPIPRGAVYFEADKKHREHSYNVAAFEIAKYPVTNAQFSPFVDDFAYDNPRFWSESGWHWKTSREWQHPRLWFDSDFNASEQPVVGVSYYEAEAFCAWLRAESKENINLATYAEWQWAAQGQTRWTYPWGNEFDKTKCNSRASAFAKPSPVDAYPDGASIFGVWDLCGNVWEWTRSGTYGGRVSAMRGGSFLDYHLSKRLRLNFISSAHAHVSSRNLGFRIARFSLLASR